MDNTINYGFVFVVIFILILFVAATSWASLKEAYNKAAEKQICKTSVLTHSRLKLKYADFSGKINCPKIELKIDDKDENAVKGQIASSMFDCWDKYGRGKLELFSDDNVYCTICTRITLNKDIKVKGITDYLSNAHPENEKLNYLQLFTTEKPGESEYSKYLASLGNRKIEDVLDASVNNEYAVVFTYIKGKEKIKNYWEKTKYTAPAVGTVALGFAVVKLGIGAGGVISAFLTPFVGVPVGTFISLTGGAMIVGGTYWAGFAAYFSGVPFEHAAFLSFIPYDAESLQSLNCNEIPVKQ